MSTHHHWIRADRVADRDRALATLDLPPTLATVSAHRRLRGPYTAVGSLLRAVGPDALARCPELGPRHRIEIQESTPELRGVVPPVPWTLAELVASDERRRYPARLHTLRLAHGLVEFLRDYLAALGDGPRALVVHDMHQADQTDREFLAVLLRRLSPTQLTVVACTDAAPLADPPWPLPTPLGPALNRHAVPLDASAAPAAPANPAADDSQTEELARAYVHSDGTADDLRLRAAYDRLDPGLRAALHDRRAAELVARDEPSLLLGAVPYHAEHGSDPSGAGARALRDAQVRCRNLGFYHAAAELGLRGRRLLDPGRDWPAWWALTGGMTMALAAAGRANEAETFLEEVRRLSVDPEVHMHLAYSTAMLYTRHFPEERRDHARARAWLNLSIALASVLTDPADRTFYSVFNRNGLALVEVRQGRMDEAVRLVTEGLERLDREFAPSEYALHRAGLRYNRAQVYGMVGRLDEAAADYTTSLEGDGNFADLYFNRATILRRMGRLEEAVADYGRALELSPPFHESYFNRGGARLELGDLEGACADFERVLELDPENTDARLNRASVLAELGNSDRAWQEVVAGLAMDPTHGHLLCLRGRLLAERGEVEAAHGALSDALQQDDSLAEAWAVRGELAFRSGDLEGAVADLDRAVELAGTPEMLFNRAVVHEAAGRFAAAVLDLDRVLARADDPDARVLRDACARAEDRPVLVPERG